MKNLFLSFINWIKNLFKKVETVKTVEKIMNEIKKEEKADSVDYSRNFEILNARPEKMSFKDYKNHLKVQKAYIRNRKKGFLVYKAAEIYETEFMNQKGEKHKEKMYRTFSPFVGVVAKLRPI